MWLLKYIAPCVYLLLVALSAIPIYLGYVQLPVKGPTPFAPVYAFLLTLPCSILGLCQSGLLYVAIAFGALFNATGIYFIFIEWQKH